MLSWCFCKSSQALRMLQLPLGEQYVYGGWNSVYTFKGRNNCLQTEITQTPEELILSCRLKYSCFIGSDQFSGFFFVYLFVFGILGWIKPWIWLHMACSHVKLTAGLIGNEAQPSIVHKHMVNTFWKTSVRWLFSFFSVWWWYYKSCRGHCTELSLLGRFYLKTILALGNFKSLSE